MAAILQKSDNSNLICFQHNTAFKTKKQFDDHLLLCEKLCSQINVCNFLLTNGRMCGKTFKRTATLLIHNWRDHNIALCSNCDESFDDIEELEEHIHTYENVHERPAKCPLCSSNFENIPNLIKHQVVKHRDEYAENKIHLKQAKNVPPKTVQSRLSFKSLNEETDTIVQVVKPVSLQKYYPEMDDPKHRILQ